MDELQGVDKLKAFEFKCLVFFHEFHDSVTRIHWKAPCFIGDDFKELEENEEYVEREDEFDLMPETEKVKESDINEDDDVDIMTVEKDYAFNRTALWYPVVHGFSYGIFICLVPSLFSLLFLHFFLYGCNIFMWRKTHINYSFVFELASTKELTYRDVFLICTTSMTAVVGIMFVHLFLIAKGRFRFLRVIRNIIPSPLYKVPLLRNLEYVACNYITGSYKTKDYGFCMRTKHYKDMAYVVSFLPYYWRAMQCARRYFDGQISHLISLGKYVSAMLAADAKVAYEKEGTIGYLCLVLVMSSSTTVNQLYWDFEKDLESLNIYVEPIIKPWLLGRMINQCRQT
uniref:EXS domain-containing protein n=1 Tax=Nelumbo nucifera TaxID=4432 RepID=A0A822XHM0_NELNU|nr:TPA_asm: hypothetical protein HUJ06_021343 [Nelumbo nucifera]